MRFGSGVILVFALCGCAAGPATMERQIAVDATEGKLSLTPFEWDGEVAQNEKVAISNVFGDLRVRSATAKHAVVSAQIQRFAGDDRDVEVTVQRDGDELRVQVRELPLPADSAAQNTVRGTNGQFDGRVDMALLLPHSAPLNAKTDAGLLHLKSYKGLATLETVSGTIQAKSPSALIAQSDSGDIAITFSGTQWDRPAELTTGSGKIAVTLPKHSNLVIQAATQGDLTAQLSKPLSRQRNMASTTLGNGAARLIVKSNSGQIQLDQENAD